MANFKSPGINKRILSICAALALCVPLVLLAQGNKGKKPSACPTVTADAVFRDGEMDGIQSGNEYSIKGNDKKYYGLEDALVCLLTEQDHDFILSTEGKTSYERASGINRKVTLDFGANNTTWLPFSATLEVDALVRVDEVLSDTDYTDPKMRFIMWFSVSRDNYRLVFDGLVIDEFNQSDWVEVTQTTNADGLREWTITCTDSHKARLEYDHRGKRYTVGHFVMPFQITVYETKKEPTCL